MSDKKKKIVIDDVVDLIIYTVEWNSWKEMRKRMLTIIIEWTLFKTIEELYDECK